MSGGPAHVSLWTGCHFEDKLRGGQWWVGGVGSRSVCVRVCVQGRENHRDREKDKGAESLKPRFDVLLIHSVYSGNVGFV